MLQLSLRRVAHQLTRITTTTTYTPRRRLTTTSVNPNATNTAEQSTVTASAAVEKTLPPQTRVEDPNGPKLGLLRSHKVFIAQGQKVKWCSCGLSKNQPYCDGSHQGTKFTPVVFEAPESKIYGLCLCKYTAKPNGICDGAHKAFVGYVKPVKTANPTPNPPPPKFDV